MRIRKLILLPFTLLALVTLACNLTRLAAGVTPTPQFDLALTLTALVPTAAPSQTPTPTGAPPAGSTPAPITGGQPTPGVPVVQITPIATYAPPPANPPTANPGGQVPPGAARVAFDANATSTLLSGLLPGSTYVEYVVRAGQGQWMEVGLTTPNSPAVLSVYVPATGQVLLGQAAGQTGWRGWLPASADYVLRLTASSAADTNYTLQVIIPERVSFAAGAVTAQRGGPIRARETHAYLLRALQGQIMTVSISAPGGNVLLAIYGLQDGQPYKRYEVGDPQFTFQLPATQDYVIQAVSVRDTPANFTIDFRVE